METLVELLLRHGAALVFVVTLLARAGAPFPAGPMLVIAGALGALGQVSLGLTVLLSLLANVLGDAVWFVGGRRYGYRVMRLLCRVSLSPDACVAQSEGYFARWGGLSLVAAKFVPGVSVIAAPMAGALRMPWRRFVAWDLLAAAVWTGLYVTLGALFRNEVRGLLAVLADAGFKALVGLGVLAALAVAGRAYKRWRQGAQVDVPRVSAAELADALAREQPPLLLDVRGAVAQQAAPPLPGARAVALMDLHLLRAQLATDAELVVYCNCPNDVSAVKAATVLAGLGFHRVRVLAGGHDAWQRAQAAEPAPLAPAAPAAHA